MVTTDLKEVFKMLFTAPAEACVEAEASYRAIWLQWLLDLQKMLKTQKLKSTKANNAIISHLDLAPVMKFDGIVECGVTMRIASISEKGKSVSTGIQLGVIETTGSFGFMHRQTNESVMQAKAQYTVTNREVSLANYLGHFSIDLASPSDLTTAISFLKKTSPILAEDASGVQTSSNQDL
ncbi:MAG: hypothetical protein V3U78_01815 [Thiotrichaceae bacterium]